MAIFSSPVIDFHVHLYPIIPLPEELKKVRTTLRDLVQPVSHFQHSLQTWIHRFPQVPRKILDELSTPTLIPHLLLESHFEDLMLQIQNHNVIKAVVVPHPPLLTNDFVFYECRKAPEKLLTCTFIDPKTLQKKEDLAAFYNRGVRIFKVNPLHSGVPAQAPYYDDYMEYLNSKKAIVILHTGNINSRLFKAPEGGDVSSYDHWFAKYPNIRFLLAHMNFHEPEKAIEYAIKYENVFLCTSWQPASVILKAAEQTTVEKIIFASDWPLLGDNISLQKMRILELQERGDLTEEDVHKIFYENAAQLLSEQGISCSE